MPRRAMPPLACVYIFLMVTFTLSAPRNTPVAERRTRIERIPNTVRHAMASATAGAASVTVSALGVELAPVGSTRA